MSTHERNGCACVHTSCVKCSEVQCCARKCSVVQCSVKNNHEDKSVCSAFVSATCIKDFKGVNKISAILNGRDIDILVDTGSTINAISSELVKLLRGKVKPLKSADFRSCTLADGSKSTFCGTAKLTVKLGDIDATVLFYVLPATYEYAILGCTFLNDYDATIDFSKRCIKLKDATINFIEEDNDNDSDNEDFVHTNIAQQFNTNSIIDSELTGDKMDRVLLQDNTDMTAAQKRNFLEMLHKRKSVFAENLSELGCCNTTTCSIELVEGTKPIYIRPYKNAWSKRVAMEEQCKEWLKAGIIRENLNPKFNFPALMVPKPNSTKERLCINFKPLNDCVTPERHPTMTIDQFLCDFGAMQGRVFSVLDLGSAYLQIPLDQQSQEYCTFTVGHRSYSFTRVPFGYVNSGHVFSRALSHVLDDLLHKCVEHFVDDLVIISPNIEQHQIDVAEVLDRLQNAGFTVEPKKSHFCKQSVDYLGFVLKSNSVCLNPKRIQKVLDYPTPRRKKDVQTFTGMCVYYRKYIPKYSALMAPLYALTKKDVDFEWTPSAEAAFQEVKQRLTTPPVLAPPNLASDEPLHVTIDGSSYGTAWVIEQKSLDPKTGVKQMKTVCYGSKSISSTEAKYHSTDLELLALENCLKSHVAMLKSKPFLVYTDNKSLVYLMKKDLESVKGVTARRLLNCREFDFDISHIKGKTNHADALSRFPGKDDPDQQFSDSGPYVFHTVTAENLQRSKKEDLEITLEELYKAQQSDQFVCDMMDFIKTGQTMDNKIEHKAIDYMIDSDLLYNVRQMRNQLEPSIRVYVPKDLVPKVLHCAHSHILSGHLGIQNTLARINQKYYWPNMSTDVANYVRACPKCAETKYGNYSKAPLIPLPVPNGPFRVLHIDTLKLQTPSNGYNYILTIVDSFSKLLITKALKNKTALTISKAIFECVIQRYGCMVKELIIVSDNAKELTMSYTKALYQLFGIKNITITPFSPSSNGQAEVFNRKILSVLRAYTSDNPRTWSQHLPHVTMAINSSQNATGYSAYQMIHGLDVSDVMDMHIASLPDTTAKTQEQAYHHWNKELQQIRNLAKHRLVENKQQQKTSYDQHAKQRDFTCGDLVYVQNTQLDLEGDTKLKQLFLGPYEIINFVSPVNVQLKDCKTGKQLPRTVHINKVKRYIPSDVQQKPKDGRSLHNDQLPVKLPLDSRTDPDADPESTATDPDADSSDVEHPPSDDDSADQPDQPDQPEHPDVQRTSPDVPIQNGASQQSQTAVESSDDPTDPSSTDGTDGADTPDVPDVPDVLDVLSDSDVLSDVLSDIDIAETIDLEATDYTDIDDEEEYYLVDKIMRVRNGPNNMDEYYVSYLGYPKKYNQWIPESDMSPNLLRRARSLKLQRAKPRL